MFIEITAALDNKQLDVASSEMLVVRLWAVIEEVNKGTTTTKETYDVGLFS